MCVNEKCVESEKTRNDKWIVEIELDVDPSLAVDINTTEALEIISVLTGIDMDKMTIGVELSTKDNTLRIIIIAEDEESAVKILYVVEELENESECNSTILCRTKNVRIAAKDTNVSSVISLHDNSHIIILVLLFLFFVVMKD